MPDNAFYAQVAYGAIIAMFVGYAISIRVRRAALRRRSAPRDSRGTP